MNTLDSLYSTVLSYFTTHFDLVLSGLPLFGLLRLPALLFFLAYQVGSPRVLGQQLLESISTEGLGQDLVHPGL